MPASVTCRSWRTAATHPYDWRPDRYHQRRNGRFNLQTRLSIPFNAPIDLTTGNSATIFLVSLGSSLADGVPDCAVPDDDGREDEEPLVSRPRSGWVVGINKIMWERTTNTLYAEADEMLEQHTRYALVVTRAVTGIDGNANRAVEGIQTRHRRRAGRR